MMTEIILILIGLILILIVYFLLRLLFRSPKAFSFFKKRPAVIFLVPVLVPIIIVCLFWVFLYINYILDIDLLGFGYMGLIIIYFWLVPVLFLLFIISLILSIIWYRRYKKKKLDLGEKIKSEDE